MGKLVLWDIDHTLLSTGGVGGEVAEFAFRMATGVMPEPVDPTGLTELELFARKLAGRRVSEGAFARFAAFQADGYTLCADELRRRGRVLPGVLDALVAVPDRPGIAQSVLSGNTRLAAIAKLEAFDLQDLLDLNIGAFGDDREQRAELVQVAWNRARWVRSVEYGPADTVVVGDAVADVVTALANGCRAVAVASGRTAADELAAAGADVVLPDLSDTAAVLAAIFASPTARS